MTRSKWLVLSSVALAIGVACGGDDTTAPAPETFTATLNGAGERPTPVTTAATASATFTLSADGNTLTWNVTTTGANNVVASHIHIGGTEVAGPIAFGLFAGTATNNPPITGSVTRAAFASPLGISFDALISLMRSGDTYVNVHTSAFPGGEIRGKITLVP